jgi:subtilisin family serine protease
VQQQLPATPTLEGFSSANQVGVAQLAIQYCNIMVNTPAAAAVVLPGVTINAQLYSTPGGISSVTSALAARVLGSGLTHQPAASTVTNELGALINNLCSSSACNGNLARVQSVTAAACATAFGSADMLIY